MLAPTLGSSRFTGSTCPLHGAVAPARQHRLLPQRIECKESRVGRAPISIPSGVNVSNSGLTYTVKGPKGELERTFSPLVRIETLEDGALRLWRSADTKKSHMFHGLSRALLNNMVKGVSEGFSKTLQLNGVGYRATVDGSTLVMNLGYSHPIRIPIPEGIDVKVTRLTTLDISGYDNEVLGQFCADIRSRRPPEPYKGKGIKYSDEVIRRKDGKRR